MIRKCPVCGQEKSSEDFYKNKTRSSGYNYECKSCARTRVKQYVAAHPDKKNKWEQDCRRKLKEEIIRHYSNGGMSCAVCGEKRLACLTIDHIAGGGTQHRVQLDRRGTAFRRWLRLQKFPAGYQILCMNCQFVKVENKREYSLGRRKTK